MEIDRPPTVYIVDDDQGIREALALLMRTVGLAATTYASGLAFLDDYTPAMRGCVLADLRMPGISGLTLIERLAARHNRMPIIMLSGYGTIPVAVRAVQAGAFDFIEKPFDDQTLLDRVQAALELSERRHLAARRHGERCARLAALSPREREVMELVVRGMLNKQIADRLDVCVNTVEVHRANLMRKLAVGSVAELVRLAVAAGVIEVETEAAG